jgi:hypothetical protein
MRGFVYEDDLVLMSLSLAGMGFLQCVHSRNIASITEAFA